MTRVGEAAQLLLARGLMHLSSMLMPRERQSWARAMRAEFDQLQAMRVDQAGPAMGHSPTVWAWGCIRVSITERINAMRLGSLAVSHWVLVPEMLLCFIPPTLALCGGFYFMWQVTQLDAVHFHKYFLANKADLAALIEICAMGVLSVCGPVGLVVAGRYLLTGRIGPPWLYRLLLWNSVTIGFATVASRLLDRGLAAFNPEADGAFDLWAGLLMLSVMPALAALHLRWLHTSAGGFSPPRPGTR